MAMVGVLAVVAAPWAEPLAASVAVQPDCCCGERHENGPASPVGISPEGCACLDCRVVASSPAYVPPSELAGLTPPAWQTRVVLAGFSAAVRHERPLLPPPKFS
ncbi:MAG: hypothetical protein HC901_02420 [Bdellovibrionaceae bacterium]|nr:hypothetical protein [Pseudobdellovibrionaceae bacterium]